MSKIQKQIGSNGEKIAMSVLSGLGIEMLERIGTPIKAIPMGQKNGRDVYQVIFGEKVSGDHRGLIGNGISVLAETKTILDRNLRYSDLREHQPARLSEHVQYGGISLLVWVHGAGAYVMRWPVAGFEAGKSITHERAQDLDIETVAFLDQIRMTHERKIQQLDDIELILKD
jgi:penicillin-binding protein-related factor A (putative recombinase)